MNVLVVRCNIINIYTVGALTQRSQGLSVRAQTIRKMLKEYERLYAEAVAVHGTRVVLFLQVGSFFEMYWAPGTAGAETAEAARDRMGLSYMKRKHPGQQPSRTNPSAAGFPMHAIDKLSALLDDGWTVCLGEQLAGTPVVRALTRSFSPSMRINCDTETASGKSGNYACCVIRRDSDTTGAAMIDVSTGKSLVTDGEGLVAALESRNVTELVLIGDFSSDEFGRVCRTIHRKSVGDVFPDCEARDILETAFGRGLVMTEDMLLLGRRPVCRDALVYLLAWTKRHSLQHGTGLPPPDILESGMHVRFSPYALQQLGVMLMDSVLNRAVTAPGKRWFRHRLCTPFARPADITDALDAVSAASASDIDGFRSALAKCGDLERLARRVLQASLPFTQVEYVAGQLEAAVVAAGIAGDEHAAGYAKGVLEAFEPALSKFAESKDVVAANTGAAQSVAALDAARKDIHVDARLEASAEGNHRIVLTKTRFATLDAAKKGALNVTPLASGLKLWNADLQVLSDAVKEAEAALQRVIDGKWAETLRGIDCDALVKLAEWARDADVTWTAAYNARRLGHVRPTVTDAAGGSFDIKALGNPVAEAFMEGYSKERYVRNDIELNGAKQHVLLYGMNSSGKSSLMKAIGMCVVLAQAGMYAPCDSMTLSPFTRVDTRILTPDDITRGLSSFTAEVFEVREALEAASPSALFLADEIFCSTEWRSATALVGTTICKLGDKGTRTFVATHYHELIDHQGLKILLSEPDRVRIMHMATSYSGSKVIWERKLRDGPCDPSYGIAIAGACGLDQSFIREATYARMHISKVPEPRRSRYNKRVVVSRCEACGEPATDSHHIQHRADAVDGKHGGVSEHHVSNLMVLCEACHKKAHVPGASVSRVHTSAGPMVIGLY